MADSTAPTHPLAGKTTLAVATMVALLAVPYASPRLARFRVGAAVSEPPPATPVVATPVLAEGEARLRASENTGGVTNALPDDDRGSAAVPPSTPGFKLQVAVEDRTGHAMDAFYAQLARTKKKEPGAVTRIVHYGDSILVSDLVAGTARRRLQGAFGDAGHGFILLANPWEWYYHNDVAHRASDGWSTSRVVGPLNKDGRYGFGGVSFRGEPGATASFGTAEKGEHGKKVSRFDVFYLEEAQGGEVTVKVAGREEKLSTKGDPGVSKVRSFAVPDGEAKLSLRVTGGSPRLYGVALERDAPGVVYDSLGMNGARARLFDSMNAQHWADQMALRKPALVILQFGTNESEDPSMPGDWYEKSLAGLLEKVKAAAKGASVLVAAPIDRAEKDGAGKLRTKPQIPKYVELQRKVALEQGVAFFDTFDAMGGAGTMARWVKANPQLGTMDFTHPTPAGGEALGELLTHALVTGFEAWEKRGGR